MISEEMVGLSVRFYRHIGNGNHEAARPAIISSVCKEPFSERFPRVNIICWDEFFGDTTMRYHGLLVVDENCQLPHADACRWSMPPMRKIYHNPPPMTEDSKEALRKAIMEQSDRTNILIPQSVPTISVELSEPWLENAEVTYTISIGGERMVIDPDHPQHPSKVGIVPINFEPTGGRNKEAERKTMDRDDLSPDAAKMMLGYREGIDFVMPAEPTGTDQCGCNLSPDAPYPACPHDLRGPEGEPGPAGPPPTDIGTPQKTVFIFDEADGIEQSESEAMMRFFKGK